MNAERIHCCSFTFGETCTSFASYVIHFFEHEHAFHIVLRTLLFNFFAGFPALVGLSGLEPPTSRLSGVRSNRLSYEPIDSGDHLLSQAASHQVPSTAQVLTVVFGMGTGVSPERIITRNLNDPCGIRTRVTAVKGRCLNPLTNGP